MHLTRVEIENLRSLRRATWIAPAEQPAGWHVVLGENASGKTTFLRAIARALLGYPGAQPELDPSGWCRDGAKKGSVRVDFQGEVPFDKDAAGDAKEGFAELTAHAEDKAPFSVQSSTHSVVLAYPPNVSDGWLSLGYGPYRRFTGGESRLEKYAAQSYARIEGHLTLFNEGAVLPEGALWVSKLAWREAEEQKKKPGRNGRSHAAEGEATQLMKGLGKLLESRGLLPSGAKLDRVTPDGIFFSVGQKTSRPLLQLSDGYKSILSIVFDLLRNMERAYGPERLFDAKGTVTAPAVVLVDEIDIHLHPTWQQKIGVALKRAFPHVQFIVTTHSPIICQAADSVVVLRKGVGEQLQGITLDRMRYGNVLDALSTGVFGADVARSRKSTQMLSRLADLNQRSLHGEKITEKMREEQKRLRSIMLTLDMDRGESGK